MTRSTTYTVRKRNDGAYQKTPVRIAFDCNGLSAVHADLRGHAYGRSPRLADMGHSCALYEENQMSGLMRVGLGSRLLVLSLMLSAVASADEKKVLTGKPVAVDGDTIKINNQRVRLFGIDSFEADQLCRDRDNKSYQCGFVASLVMMDVMASVETITCNVINTDRYKRYVARCYFATGVDGDAIEAGAGEAGSDVAAFMVAQGWALDWPHYSKGEYAGMQVAAARDKLGVWQGTFLEPWEYRSRNN
jgi:endonuclease YncB( thermonuclease family)